jgi:ubiquitin-like modifier-activating enzyme ATG7
LAKASIDLNLQLMKWRLCPELDLDIIKQQKCLIFGAGTLGCNVARALIGWNITTITFIDSGIVSYSNPVRQSLFTQDYVGLPKVEAAILELEAIISGRNLSSSAQLQHGLNAVQLEVPMPGHTLLKSFTELSDDLQLIENLVKEHDVLFLLTDSREFRWLPTVLGAIHEKIVLTVALGFDDFVIMRHGFGASSPNEQKCDLGCYFCSDIISPKDTMSQRTLDQQCTISRPGLSMTASAMAVELFVTLLQHPLR